MPRYSYTAQTSGGELVAAIADAASLPALAADLAASGSAIRTARAIEQEAPFIRGIPYFEVLGIYRQIASAIEAGLPLKESLGMLSSESRNPKLRSLLRFLECQVAEGTPLSDAMKLFPRIFPEVHIAVIKAGEEGERLGVVLEELAERAESLANMSRRFASALVYPTVISLAALALMNFAFVFIMPRFIGLFSDLGIRELPFMTNLVIFIGRWVAPATLLLIAAAVILSLVVYTQRRAASGRLWLDAWKLRVPLIGQIVEKSSVARFAGTLGVLLEAGIELPRALDMAAEGTGNTTVERVIKNVAIDVERGDTLSESVDRHQAMPPTLAWRIGVGEESGTLAESLTKISGLYAQQVDNLVVALAGLVEPMLILTVGSGVMLLVLGMLLPLVAVIQNLSGGG